MSSVSWTPPAPGEIPAPPLVQAKDIHSFANLLEIKPKHIDIDWTVDWDKRIISGSVTHTVQVLKDGISQLILDTNFLQVDRVSEADKALQWSLGKRKGTLGSPLVVELGTRKEGEKIQIKIAYSTTKDCTALGWLTAEQTESKKSPFLYSQAQAIHARSMLPCVDSPSHKITYTAKVKSEVPILMSALAEGSIRATTSEPGEAYSKEEGVYRFRQPVGIPSYLIAIVGGKLEFRALAPRVGVWAESTMIDRAEWEFKHDANRFLEAAEEIISPYSWTRYDCVVLPPSFPYGGMENANLTTLTPALICGDRSQTDVLLHELAHSWSGNLTSCANWSSFWLNEGINVWIERLLLQVVHGPEAGPAYRGFSYIIGAKALRDALEQFESVKRFQRLVPVFHDGEDPDDAFSSIPYEKGSNLILHLEKTVGGLDVFLPFIRSHFKTFYDRSLTTEEWKQHLFDFYAGNANITKKLHAVDWHAWLHGEGLELPVQMEYDDTLAVQAKKLAYRWIRLVEGKTSTEKEKFGSTDIQGWDTNQVVVFLESLHSGPKLSAEHAQILDKTYAFSNSDNSEIRLRFYEVALEDTKTQYKNEAAIWVAKQGRMKYCRVLYRALNKVDPDLARSTFTKNRSFYHPIAAAMIASDLGLHAKVGTSKAIIAVCGSTGTGKSQLAVDIAKFVGKGAIVSADSMQLYRGLDIITNKVTEEEMHGVPHYLINLLDPVAAGSDYDVGSFVRDANEIMKDLLHDNVLPIVVGGTTYYLQHLLLPGRLVSTSHSSSKTRSGNPTPMSSAEVEKVASKASTVPLTVEQLKLLHRVVNLPHASTDVQASPMELWTVLQCLDAEMAKRWHFRDTRKIIRSIKILFETGERHSEVIEKQSVREEVSDSADAANTSFRILFFYLQCDRTILNERLDSRIDKMIDNGLLREIVQLRAIARRGCCQTDYTRGIFQAIGYKEFDSYLQHLEERRESRAKYSGDPDDTPLLRPQPADEKGSSLFRHGVEEMKAATRQYARRQVSWVRNKLRPEIAKRNDGSVHFVTLQATDLQQWDTNVRERALQITSDFLWSRLPDGVTEKEVTEDDDAEDGRDKTFRVCEVCTIDDLQPHMVIGSMWEAHQRGRAHRAALRSRRGKQTAKTGPEVEMIRRERQQRRMSDRGNVACDASIVQTKG